MCDRPLRSEAGGDAWNRRTVVAAAGSAGLVGLHGAKAHAAGGEPMLAAMQALLDSLDSEQRRRLERAFDDGRHDWHYVPRERPGLPLRDMSLGQRRLVWRLVESALSARGLAQSEGVLALEAVLHERSGHSAFRDPLNYALVLFGRPGAEPGTAWAWRFEGHHLSITFTVVPERGIAVTPHFIGANPASHPVLHEDGRQAPLLAAEGELAFALMRSFDEELRRRVVLDAASPADIITRPGREASLRTPAGVPLGDLGPAQRAQAMALVELYAGRLRADLAAREVAAIRDAGIDAIHLAWAGPVQEGQRCYYRLHGPSMIIEYDNTTGDHVHTVWHDPTNLFGQDLLARHRHEAHPG